MTTPAPASPTKLRDGTWGARVSSAEVSVGDEVTITTRGGKSWPAIVDRVVYRSPGDGIAICATTSHPQDQRPAAQAPTETDYAGRAGGARHETGKRNRRPGYCDRCDRHLEIGAGTLEYCVEDSGCSRHHDEGGWHLYCADTTACATRRDGLVEAAHAQLARAEALRELAAEVEATEPSSQPLSWDEQKEGTRYAADGTTPHTGRQYQAEWVVTADPEGFVWWSHPRPNPYDGWDARWWRVEDERLAERARQLLEEGRS